MNHYLISMSFAMVTFLAISFFVSRKVKDANDFYVAGRRAPLLLVVGSMIASYASTGMFMGDAAEAFNGALSPMLIFAGMQSAGYIVGAIFFGRYLRRANVLTIPEFFGKRFNSLAMRRVAAITAIIMMSVYYLSVIQGVGTLMSLVTNLDYKTCLVISVVVLTIITVVSGSRGVLITDTLMLSMFTIGVLVSIFFISSKINNKDGWFFAIEKLTTLPQTRNLLSWAGKPGALYNTGLENVIWGLSYGIVWMSVCAIGPWQSSRYMMAKNEHTVIRSAPFAALGVFILEFFVCTTAALLNVLNPEIESSSHIWIWASMNVLPTILGVILMTGVLFAGISSATTFLSLVGASVANDVVVIENKDHSIKYGRIAMCIVSIIVLSLALLNPASIFAIMFLGGATAASSWMPVAFGCIFSKRMTRAGAIAGMISGMVAVLVANLAQKFGGFTLPSYLDPAIIGIFCNVVAIIIGSALTQVSKEEKIARETLFIMPEAEKNPIEMKKTKKFLQGGFVVGVLMTLLLLFFWIIPYLRAL